MNQQEEKYKAFNCKICLDVAKEPVTTPCGHMYCWECINHWAENKGNPLKCPYCNNEFDIEKVTTIFAGNEENRRKKAPPRPQNPRAQGNQNNGGGFFSNWNVGFIGFPFMFGFQFGNFGNQNTNNANPANRGQQKYLILIFCIMIFFNIILPFLNSFSYERESYKGSRNDHRRQYTENQYEYGHDGNYWLFGIAVGLFFGLNYFIRHFNNVLGI